MKFYSLIFSIYLLLGTIPALDDFEGDILLTKVQQAMTMPLHRDVADAGVWDKAEYLWPERTVPYYIPPNLGRFPLVTICCKCAVFHQDVSTCFDKRENFK